MTDMSELVKCVLEAQQNAVLVPVLVIFTAVCIKSHCSLHQIFVIHLVIAHNPFIVFL